MKKYAVLVYQYLSTHQSDFSVISEPWDNVQVWPNALPVKITDGSGQVQYQWPVTTMFKIVEGQEWGQSQTDAIDAAAAMWNESYPDRQIPDTLQLIFTESEAGGISGIFEAERARLIEALNE